MSLRLANLCRNEGASPGQVLCYNLGGDRFNIWIPWLAEFNPDIELAEPSSRTSFQGRNAGLPENDPTMNICGHVQTVVYRRLEEGDELIMSLMF